ncbi:hypothetical protein CBM2634_U350005 [Cupriavidus taiwanensis]|uniref:Uncharacterized protein n=1 Tax=Cupriavidus taiwanensis TaxID=164546 RepID=A0A375JGR7_9BURK|nr:hypothetical protein CBM2634_U350005 [Cupriavidus taiwanensis]
MRESRTRGSVRGVPSNGHSYRDMLFEVVKLCQEGRLLHRGWWGGQRLYRGNLVIQEGRDPKANRTMLQFPGRQHMMQAGRCVSHG